MLSLFPYLAALMMLGQNPAGNQPEIWLDQTDYQVSDTTKYESLRLKVLTTSDSLVVIEQADPSCGCILATVQRNLVTKEKPGEFYVAVTSAKMSTLQPVTIDVYTNRNREKPLRLTIHKGSQR